MEAKEYLAMIHRALWPEAWGGEWTEWDSASDYLEAIAALIQAAEMDGHITPEDEDIWTGEPASALVVGSEWVYVRKNASGHEIKQPYIIKEIMEGRRGQMVKALSPDGQLLSLYSTNDWLWHAITKERDEKRIAYYEQEDGVAKC